MRFDVLKAVSVKIRSTAFWHLKQYNLINRYQLSEKPDAYIFRELKAADSYETCVTISLYTRRHIPEETVIRAVSYVFFGGLIHDEPSSWTYVSIEW
jgi:hypothetical protein